MGDWLNNLGVNEWVAIGSALIAVLSFVFNWAVVRRQMAMQYESLRAQMDGEMMAWAHEAIDLVSDGARLAKGRGLAYGEQELRPMLLETAQRLSAAADRGRLFFPNVEHHKHGQDKEAAFQGFRPVILDAVIFAHYQVDKIEPSGAGPDQAAADYLTKCRRLLVSEVQSAVDPRRRGPNDEAAFRRRPRQSFRKFPRCVGLGGGFAHALPRFRRRRARRGLDQAPRAS